MLVCERCSPQRAGVRRLPVLQSGEGRGLQTGEAEAAGEAGGVSGGPGGVVNNSAIVLPASASAPASPRRAGAVLPPSWVRWIVPRAAGTCRSAPGPARRPRLGAPGTGARHDSGHRSGPGRPSASPISGGFYRCANHIQPRFRAPLKDPNTRALSVPENGPLGKRSLIRSPARPQGRLALFLASEVSESGTASCSVERPHYARAF
jgi:hypothetical protein